MAETICPECRKPKVKLNKNDPRLLEILREFNKKNIDELSDLSLKILELAEYTFDCNCPPYIINLKRKIQGG